MVIGLSSKNGHCAVDLLNGHYSYHLVRERHLTQRELAVGAGVHRFAESVRATDDEPQIPTGCQFLLHPLRQFYRTVFRAMLVQQYHVGRSGHGLQDLVALTLLKLF